MNCEKLPDTIQVMTTTQIDKNSVGYDH